MMTFFSTVFVLTSVAVCAAGLNYEANDGDSVTMTFHTAELDRAERVTITHGSQIEREVILRFCRCVHCNDCSVVETPGVILKAEEKTLTLLQVSSRHSGLYEAKIITGNNLFKENATLHVNSREPVLSFSEETQTSSKPPESSKRQRHYALISPVFFILVVSVVLGLFWKNTRASVI